MPTSNNQIFEPTVFLIDDHAAIRRALKRVLTQEHIATTEFESAPHFLAEYDPNRPGCIISDILMPHMSGVELQAELKQRHIKTPLILMSAHSDVATAKKALKNGAVDFLEKPISNAELIGSVQEAFEYDQQQRAKQRQQQTLCAQLSCLTKREKEVLDHLMTGKSNKEIASQLNISLRTVETHRNRVLTKMHVKNLQELTRILLTTSD